MAVDTYTRSTDFTRCAVCKIDLKGRFVYVDDEAEKIFGHNREHLFGKCLAELLDEASQLLLNQLLSERNHYESFYDACTLTIVSRDKQLVPVRAIVSLNFDCGNPVNFQLILDTIAVDLAYEPRSFQDIAYADFLKSMLALEGHHDFKQFLETLRRFTGALQASLYLLKDGRLEPRSAASSAESSPFDFESIPQPTPLHEKVAETGGEYAFTEPNADDPAVEDDGSGPAEYLNGFALGSSRRYLLRLVFAQETNQVSAREGVDRARLAMSLSDRFFGAQPTDDYESDYAVDVKFTIGFLDNLGIGAFLTDDGGNVVGYNRSLLQLVAGSHPGSNYRDFVTQMGVRNSARLIKMIENRCGGSSETASIRDLAVPITLASGDQLQLVVTSLSDDQGDLSACFVLMPNADNADRTRSSSLNQNSLPQTMLTDSLRAESRDDA